MKISLITRHAVSNYGSLLQAMATQSILIKIGHECEIIDYIREDEDYRHVAKSLLEKNNKWNNNFLKRVLYLLIQSPEYFLMGKKFEEMRKQYLNLTKLYRSIDELRADTPVADVYMTGSDQVWGAIGFEEYDAVYFLDFLEESKKIISYAGSFGKINFNSRVMKAYKKFLQKYEYITVRERSAMKIIQQLDIKDVSFVLDPTLLISGEEWSEFINEKISCNYVLIYQINNNKKMDLYAKEFAKRAGLKLIRITPIFHQIIRGGKTKFLPSVGKFLAYIKNASYMITDSFHGTAFAINFNTQFIDILPGETKTRNQSLLELTGLNNRILYSYDDFHFLNQMIDYEKVNQVVQKYRKKSIKILQEMIV